MKINDRAPAHARDDILIAAPLELVWQLHCDVDNWANWQPDISRAKLDTPLAIGASFTWKAGPAAIASRIEAFEPQRTMGWSGKAMGARALHVWHFDRRGDQTYVETAESLEGLVIRMAGRKAQAMLEKTCRRWLEALKAEAERRHAG
ncbi:MAG: SRPBCC family protein [Deltaproteobacteria bacterium]|nr:SRPBCC family protein [Deltaproteobacteria bacterium]